MWWNALTGIISGAWQRALAGLRSMWKAAVDHDAQRTKEEALERRLDVEKRVNEMDADDLRDRAREWVRREDD